jgi:hypothetical protein
MRCWSTLNFWLPWRKYYPLTAGQVTEGWNVRRSEPHNCNGTFRNASSVPSLLIGDQQLRRFAICETFLRRRNNENFKMAIESFAWTRVSTTGGLAGHSSAPCSCGQEFWIRSSRAGSQLTFSSRAYEMSTERESNNYWHNIRLLLFRPQTLFCSLDSKWHLQTEDFIQRKPLSQGGRGDARESSEELREGGETVGGDSSEGATLVAPD